MKNPSLPGEDIWRQLSDRAFRKHPGRHLELDPVNAVGLDHYLNRVVPAVRHEEISEENPDGVHASPQLKGMCAPRPSLRHSINHDGGSTEIKKKGKRKEAGFDLYAGPWLLCGHCSYPIRL